MTDKRNCRYLHLLSRHWAPCDNQEAQMILEAAQSTQRPTEEIKETRMKGGSRAWFGTRVYKWTCESLLQLSDISRWPNWKSTLSSNDWAERDEDIYIQYDAVLYDLKMCEWSSHSSAHVKDRQCQPNGAARSSQAPSFLSQIDNGFITFSERKTRVMAPWLCSQWVGCVERGDIFGLTLVRLKELTSLIPNTWLMWKLGGLERRGV